MENTPLPVQKNSTGLIAAIIFSAIIVSGSISFLGYQMYQQNTSALASLLSVVDDDPFLGDEDAPVTLVEFSDYQCPYCARHYTQTFSQIVSQYVNTGKLKYVFRDYPLDFHPSAVPASSAANCAMEQGGNESYFDMHGKIFSNQPALNTSDLTALFSGYAAEIGLSVSEFTTCYTANKFEQEIEQDYLSGSSSGVSGTPGFILIGADGSKKVLSGAQPFSVFQREIDAAL